MGKLPSEELNVFCSGPFLLFWGMMWEMDLLPLGSDTKSCLENDQATPLGLACLLPDGYMRKINGSFV